jgi:hypothetical protein
MSDWWIELQTDSGETHIDRREICAVTLENDSLTYSIHMKSGTIFTTQDKISISRILYVERKYPVMK